MGDFLEVIKEGTVIDRIALQPGNTVLGRNDELCNIVLLHASISRKHAQLVLDESGALLLEDLGSAHGTKVNKRGLSPNQKVGINIGDIIKFGESSRFYHLCREGSDEEKTETQPVEVSVSTAQLKINKDIELAEKMLKKVDQKYKTVESLQQEISKLQNSTEIKAHQTDEISRKEENIAKLQGEISQLEKTIMKLKGLEDESITNVGSEQIFYDNNDFDDDDGFFDRTSSTKTTVKRMKNASAKQKNQTVETIETVERDIKRLEAEKRTTTHSLSEIDAKVGNLSSNEHHSLLQELTTEKNLLEAKLRHTCAEIEKLARLRSFLDCENTSTPVNPTALKAVDAEGFVVPSLGTEPAIKKRKTNLFSAATSADFKESDQHTVTKAQPKAKQQKKDLAMKQKLIEKRDKPEHKKEKDHDDDEDTFSPFLESSKPKKDSKLKQRLRALGY